MTKRGAKFVVVMVVEVLFTLNFHNELSSIAILGLISLVRI